MSRKIAREYAYKLIFEFLFNHTRNQHTYDIFTHLDLDAGDVEYLGKVYNGVMTEYEDLTKEIEKYAHGFTLDRIYKPDIAALLLSVYEMKYMTDIPHSVSMNEAVLLVKKYSTDKSHSFVNGILSSVHKELEEKNGNN